MWKTISLMTICSLIILSPIHGQQCPYDDPAECEDDYIRFDTFEYIEFDVDDDGIPDPGRSRNITVWDSDGDVTYFDEVEGISFRGSASGNPLSTFCGSSAPNSCERNCVIGEGSSETGQLINADFLTVNTCSNLVLVIVDDKAEFVDNAQEFYNHCVITSMVGYNTGIGNKMDATRHSVQDRLFGWAAIDGVLIKFEPALERAVGKVAGRIIGGLAAIDLIFQEFGAMDDLGEFAVFAAINGCALYEREETCFEEASDTFGNSNITRKENDIDGMIAALEFTGIVNRTCPNR